MIDQILNVLTVLKNSFFPKKSRISYGEHHIQPPFHFNCKSHIEPIYEVDARLTDEECEQLSKFIDNIYKPKINLDCHDVLNSINNVQQQIKKVQAKCIVCFNLECSCKFQ